MAVCSHKTLILLAENEDRLRCRHCHLVISAEELGNGDCPECRSVRGERRRDFDRITPGTGETVRYRCQACGASIEWDGPNERSAPTGL